MTWPIEDIPDPDRVFMRAHKNVARGEIRPGLFSPKGDNDLSCNWEKYCTPDACRDKAKVPVANGVLVGVVRAIRDASLSVSHTPVQLAEGSEGDRSHTSINGRDLVKEGSLARLDLVHIFQWAIAAPAQ